MSWVLLGIVLVVCITIDLFVHRGDHAESHRSAIKWSIFWVALSLGFAVFVTVHHGRTAGEQFLGAYLLEKSLSLDNLFLFIVIFAQLGIPRAEQRRVLTFGILGALATRLAFIVLGVAVLQRWHEVTYVLGAFLVITAIKLIKDNSANEGPPKALLWAERHLPWTRELHGHRFFARVRGKRVATPLLVALIGIELADIVFALDSVPAAFAISEDTFILYSSNVFAVLGLRALYIVLANALTGLHYLKYGLAAVIAFAGAKMLLAPWISITPLLSVAVIAGTIAIAVIASLRAKRALVTQAG